jgi:hypothetical protein
MKEADFQDARLRHAAGVLFENISRLATGMAMEPATIAAIADWIAIHRADCKRMGIDFPEMVVVAFPRLGAIEICRRDWTVPDVETFILDCVSKYPTISAAEIAEAIKKAWPGYKPRAATELLAMRAGRAN